MLRRPRSGGSAGLGGMSADPRVLLGKPWPPGPAPPARGLECVLGAVRVAGGVRVLTPPPRTPPRPAFFTKGSALSAGRGVSNPRRHGKHGVSKTENQVVGEGLETPGEPPRAATRLAAELPGPRGARHLPSPGPVGRSPVSLWPSWAGPRMGQPWPPAGSQGECSVGSRLPSSSRF